MSIYGEGLYRLPDGTETAAVERTLQQLQSGQWEPRSAFGHPVIAVPTPERKRPSLSSVYALSKYDQERLCLMTGRAYNLPTVALRFFNVYGTRQALGNPYTGVLAIFAARLLNGNPPLIFEDGLQQRDFVNVKDVAGACVLALEKPEAVYGVFNVGSGRAYTVREVARRMAETLGKPQIRPEITGQYRMGDIRHCYADISHARKALGFEPQVPFARGLEELTEWLRRQVATDRVAQMRAELEARGLTA